MKGPDDEVVFVGVGVVSPWGVGFGALSKGLHDGRICIDHEVFPGLGNIPVARCREVSDALHEDRSVTLMREAFAQIEAPLASLQARFSPADRAVCVATSKGALRRYAEDPHRGTLPITDLTADALAVDVAKWAGAEGPRLALVSACATGLQNVFRAAELLQENRCEFALAGSAEATLTPLYLASFLHLGAHARSGCFPYDTRREGFVAGEGAAIFLLTKRATAQNLGLPIRARLPSWGTAGEGHHATAVEPTGRRLAKLLAAVSGRGAPDALCGHGTGTALNDDAEAWALSAAFGGNMPPLFAVKGAIGHLMGAAGAVELAACIAALEGNFLPPTAGHATPSEAATCLRIVPVGDDRQLRTILKWNLGFGGHLVAGLIAREG